MPLSADQRAMLQLLLERGQGYSDLSELLSVTDDEVHDRARAALRELAGEDPDASVGLTDYLLGQADPIGRADVVRHLRENPDDHRLATDLVAALRSEFPDAKLPRLAGEPRAGRFLRRVPGARAPGEDDAAAVPRGAGSGSGLSAHQTRLIVVLGSVAILLVAGVLALTGAFGGEDEPEATTDAAATTADETPPQGSETAVPVDLRPVGGSDASGRVVFGFATGDQPYVDIQVDRLQPPTEREAYLMWFLLPGGTGYPIPAAIPVNAQGRYSDRVSVPAQVFGVLQQAESVVIALNDRREITRLINRAVGEEQTEIQFPGGTVLEANLRQGGGGQG